MRKRLLTISRSEVQVPAEVQRRTEEHGSSEQTEGSEQYTQQGVRKKVRGPTLKRVVWDLESNERIVVTFDETGQPVGDEGVEFAGFLGTLVKMPQHVGINYLDWRKIPQHKKEDLWNIVKEKFYFCSC